MLRKASEFVADMMAEIIRSAEIREETEFTSRADSSDSLRDKYRKIRAAYAYKQRMVDEGLSSWGRSDPYELAEWPKLFTPIEEDAWCEIRYRNLPLWPQFPVGTFFVDFGNPEKRVALECDGKQWHDPKVDAERDAALAKMGWRVFRVTGSQCAKTRFMRSPDDILADGDEVPEGYEAEYLATTLAGVMRELKSIFSGEGK